jgi:hypothetical protein
MEMAMLPEEKNVSGRAIQQQSVSVRKHKSATLCGDRWLEGCQS